MEYRAKKDLLNKISKSIDEDEAMLTEMKKNLKIDKKTINRTNLLQVYKLFLIDIIRFSFLLNIL